MTTMKRYADFAVSAVMVWTFIGLFLLVIAAGIAGSDSWITYAIAAIFLGPFFVTSFALIVSSYGGELRDEWRDARTRQSRAR